jgi:MYXO-CTERM domain-containing protein
MTDAPGPPKFIETGIFVALAAALLAVAFFVTRRRDA